jgi:hypothetical protein
LLRLLLRWLTGQEAGPSVPQLTSRIVVTRPLFVLSPDLLIALRTRRENASRDDVERQYDAFLLDPGLGPPTYLTADGRILWDDDIWDVKGTRWAALAAIRSGIHKTGLQEIATLFPARTVDAKDCEECTGTGRFVVPGTDGEPFSIVCKRCAGVGWTAPSLPLDEVVSAA